MSEPQKMPSDSPKQPARRGLFVFFAALAVVVVAAGSYWQYRHTEEIPALTTSEDSLVAKNREAGEAFLAQKSKESGVQTLGGGLLYKVLKSGSGQSPTASSTVVVDYEGRLIDGTVFDSSYRRGESAEFPVNGVIQGWQIALKAMKPGDEWELYIPAYLAYGENGSGSNIPPASALVFKVALHSVK